MNRLNESVKIDLAVVPQTISNTNVTGEYFDFSQFSRGLFVVEIGALAETKTVKIELFEAQDAAGTGAQELASSEWTLTSMTDIIAGTIDLTSAANTDTVTVNGVTFTMAASTSAADRTFSNAAGLETCINHATYGVSGVTASDDGAVVTVTATDPGKVDLTVSYVEKAGNIVLATTKALGFVDLDANKLSINDGFTHVGAKLTSTGAGIVGAALLRYDSRSTPVNVGKGLNV